MILKKIKELDGLSGSILKENLPPEITYTKLRAVIAYHLRMNEMG